MTTPTKENGYFKKHDKVSFSHKAKTVNAIVVGNIHNNKIEVVSIGRKYSYTVPENLLKHTNFSMPEEPKDQMDVWTIDGFNTSHILSNTSRAGSATILYKNNPLLTMIMNGDSTPNRYLSNNGRYEDFIQFENAAKTWMRNHDIPDYMTAEATDIWAIWKTERQPYGVTASDYLNNYKNQMEHILKYTPDNLKEENTESANFKM